MARLFLILLLALPALADPQLSSWLTGPSGSYARIYETDEDEDARNAVSTWSRGAGTQALPTYAGVSEISYTGSDVYIRTTNLGFHIMGPWYNNGNLFPNYPANTAATYRFPRTPTPAVSFTATGDGPIGYFVDGVAMFDSRDAFSYSNGNGQDASPGTAFNGDGVWNRDAYVNESDTFDPANAHQAGPTYHYHANPPALRHLLGDSVSYDAPTNTYAESSNGGHSPIIGWVRDGYPVYGPYGYDDQNNAGSTVRRMLSGYRKRALATGAARTTLPQWVFDLQGRSTTLTPGQYGPDVDAVIGGETYTLGRYLEDYEYKGDVGETQGVDFDLDRHNGRFCVTPEFPAGTYAYFTSIEPDGTPSFPYNIGRVFYGEPVGNSATIPAGAETFFEGGPERAPAMAALDVEVDSGNVTLTWNAAEGGHYQIESSPSVAGPFNETGPSVKATSGKAAAGLSATADKQFYRVRFDYLEPFDDNGFAYDNSIVSTPPQHNVLLLILDDWGIDSSELYNSPGPGIQLADMPNLEALAVSGLLFTRGYSQPICSPTRATILTGRLPYQHTVGNPQADSTLPASELTFPEIMATGAPDYGLVSFGKWHLGSGDTGPFETGGWPNFSGTTGGAVPDYASWTRVKIENGVVTDAGTNVTSLVPGTYATPYATSVQVDEAVSFITAQGTDPWVVWMGFNAPHTPFHDPAPYVTPTGGYSTSGTGNKDLYIRMLEALDHEIGRLLASVDLTKTNIIVVGDNGTPTQVDQPPAGGIAGAKGSLNEGGIHVPFFASGPDVLVTGTTDTLVHVSDLFTTILDLTHVNVESATVGIELHSNSLVPIFCGTDTADRCMIAEMFGQDPATDGRSLIMDDWPQYKLVSIQDVTDPADTPSYQMYEIGSNGMEANTLITPPNPGDPHEAAYLALVAKDEELVEVPDPAGPTLYLELPNITGPAGVPNNANLDPTSIDVDGTSATYVARFDQTDTYNQFWVKCTMPLGSTEPYTTAVVTFPDNPFTGDPRVFTTVQIVEAP